MSSPAQGGPPRLTPAMSSRRLQVLDFVRAYIAAHNGSPSLSEIAGGIGISRARAHQLVNTLVRQKLLLRRRGPRGLILPSAIEDAKRKLREAGYVVDEDFAGGAYTDSRLLPLVELDYVPDRTSDGTGGDGGGGSAAGGRNTG